MTHKYPIRKVKGITKTVHRLVAERMLGRPLKKEEIVHHKDGNIKNYSEDNLEITNIKAHGRIHYPRIEVKCFRCGKIREISKKKYKWKIAHGQKQIYCSKKCAIKNSLGTYKSEIDDIIIKGLKEGKTIYKISKEYPNLNRVTMHNHYNNNIIKLNIPINSIHIRRFKEGLFWCNKCGTYLPKTSFSKNSNKSYGISSYCKECRKKFKC